MRSYNALDGAFQVQRSCVRVKPKLLVVELWGMGDLVIATPFLQIFLFTLWSGLAYRYKVTQTSVRILMPSVSKSRR